MRPQIHPRFLSNNISSKSVGFIFFFVRFVKFFPQRQWFLQLRCDLDNCVVVSNLPWPWSPPPPPPHQEQDLRSGVLDRFAVALSLDNAPLSTAQRIEAVQGVMDWTSMEPEQMQEVERKEDALRTRILFSRCRLWASTAKKKTRATRTLCIFSSAGLEL